MGGWASSTRGACRWVPLLLSVAASAAAPAAAGPCSGPPQVLTSPILAPPALLLRLHFPTQITVDGDTSTNDTVIGLASGQAGGPGTLWGADEDVDLRTAWGTVLCAAAACSMLSCMMMAYRGCSAGTLPHPCPPQCLPAHCSHQRPGLP